MAAKLSKKSAISDEPQTALWASIHDKLKKHIPRQFFKVFFGDLEPLSFKGNSLVLASADARVVAHIKQRYLPLINRYANEVSEGKIVVKVKTRPTDSKAEPKKDHKVKKPRTIPTQTTSEEGRDGGSGAYPNTIILNPKYTFDRFVRGPSNEHAFAASFGAAQRPSEFHNPLYLYGGVGLGKTHLMMAIGNHIQDNFPWMNVQYTPAEIFQSDLVEAVATKTLPHFKAKYRNIDVLLFDDIQFISQRAEYTQEEIFHTFNYLYQNKKQIVISGDRPPQQLSTLTDRLVSRFQSGLIVDIKPPSLETRLAILKTKAEEIQLDIPYEVLKYVAVRITGQIRVLEAALIKLKFISELEKHPIDLQLTKLALRDLPNEKPGPQVSIDEILRVVSKHFGVEEAEVKGNSRVENIVMARHVCMYLTKKLLPSMSLAAIAEAFGRSDHTTVMHAEKKIKEMVDRDEAFRVQLQELHDELQF